MDNTRIEIEEAIVIRSFSQPESDSAPVREVAERARLRAILLIGLLLLVVFGAATYHVSRGAFYANQAEGNISRTLYVPATRGLIYDRFGEPLLENRPSFRLSILPGQLPEDGKERAAIIAELSDIIDIPDSEIRSKLKEGAQRFYGEILISRTLTHEQAIALRARDLAGVRLIDEVKRRYIDGEVFSQIIGYVGIPTNDELDANDELQSNDIIGKSGLERYYDDVLRGESGKKYLLKTLQTRSFEENGEELPQPGSALHTTIDADFQRYFHRRLNSALGSLGRRKAIGIALNPQNGEVLSMLSLPAYNSNWFVETREYADELNALFRDADQPLFNRAIGGLYSPGSTIKPLVGLAALEEGLVSPQRYFDDPGYLLVPNPYDPDTPSVFVDWKAHGPVNLRKALAVSANVYFYIIGGGTDFFEHGLGIARLTQHFSAFMLDSVLGIDLPGEIAGKLPDWNNKDRDIPWRLGDTYNVSIGQGELRITPIGLLSYIAALGNGGTLYRPHIVKEVQDAETDEMTTIEPKALATKLASQDSLETIQAGMEDVVDKWYGTGYIMHDLPFPVAAKSGTAQYGRDKRINALFVAYAPVENPQVAVLVVIEDAIDGSLNATPVVKDVLMWYYTNRGFE